MCVCVCVCVSTFGLSRGIRCDRVRIHRNLFVAVLAHVTILLVKNVDQLIALSAPDIGYAGAALGRTVSSLPVPARPNLQRTENKAVIDRRLRPPVSK